MVTTFYPPYHFGGDATYVRALSRALVARGHEVEVVHSVDAYKLKGGGNRASAEAIDDGITVHRLESRLGPISPLITQQTGRPGLMSRRLRKILDGGFDVVNYHNISLVGGPSVLRYSRAPVTLYTLHEHWLLCPTHIFWKNRSRACDRQTCFTCSLRSGIPPQLWRYTGLAAKAVATVDALLAPSEYTAQRHRAAGFTPAISVLPLFSDLDFSPGEDYQPPSRPQFIYVGRIELFKGVPSLLATFSKLPQYDLLVIGEGEHRQRLERQYAACANIRFLGQIAQAKLVDHYSRATALIFPSIAPETFGLSIVEAFTCGTPVIAHDAGGCREIIDATGGGIVYRNADELNAALHELAHDAEVRRSYAKRARNGYERFYTKQQHVTKYLQYIEAIRRTKKLSVGNK